MGMNGVRALRLLAAAAVVTGLAGCATTVPNSSGVAPVTIDPATRGPVAGVGIEQQDIIAMTDQMMRDMLANPQLARRQTPPRVIIDASDFANDSSQPINRNLITDRLRVNLNRASQGRMTFINRVNTQMVERERELKRAGQVDSGTAGMARRVMGGDFKLSGRIASLDSRNPRTGMIQRFTQITFEMTDLETGEIVFGGEYSFARAGADDVIYR